MINANKLRGKIVENGLTVEAVAEQMGMDRSTLYRKMRPDTGTSFTVGEARAIGRILKLSAQDVMAIFFSDYVA